MMRPKYNSNPIIVYQQVLSGKLKMFPKGYWSGEDNLERARRITRYLIFRKLKWSEDDVKNKLSKNTFVKNKLGGMLNIVFNGSAYEALNNAFPKKYKKSDLSSYIITNDKIISQLKDKGEDFKMITYDTIKLENSIELYKCILEGKDMYRFPRNYWNTKEGKKIAKKLMKWLFETKLKWSEEDLKSNLNLNVFRKYKLHGMLVLLFDSSPYKAINYVYPDKYREWEFNKTPRKFWNEINAAEATKWLIETKLKWDEDDVKEKLTSVTFKENGLSGMIKSMYGGSPYKAINKAYPDTYKAWELKNAYKDCWNLATAVDAVKWLIDTKLKWNMEDVKQKLSINIFIEHGLYGMMCKMFKCSTYDAIDAAYPGVYNKFDIKSYKNFNKNWSGWNDC